MGLGGGVWWRVGIILCTGCEDGIVAYLIVLSTCVCVCVLLYAAL